MKKLLHTVQIAALCLLISGCNSYNFRTDMPTGTMQYDALDSSGEEITYSSYKGEYVVNAEAPLKCGDRYYDDNLTVISKERRLSKEIWNLYLYNTCVLNKFTVDVIFYDDNGAILSQQKSIEQMVLGNQYNSIIIEAPQNYAFYSVISYSGEYVGDIIKISMYDLKDASDLVKLSGTTYHSKITNAIIVLYTADGRIVWGTNNTNKEETFIVGRNYVEKYGIVEVIE